MIDLKADLEGSKDLRDPFLYRLKSPKFLTRTQKLRTGPSPFVIGSAIYCKSIRQRNRELDTVLKTSSSVGGVTIIP